MDIGVTTKIMAVINEDFTSKTVRIGLYILDGLCTVNDLMHQIEAGENLEDIAKAMVQGGITSIHLVPLLSLYLQGFLLLLFDA